MSDLTEARHQLAIANRIVANEGVIDAFGHCSIRHPDDPNRYLISRSRAPELVEPDDILEFTLNSEPVQPLTVRPYGELPLHGCIYQARPDVKAICHHHGNAVLPFCISGVELVPVFHMGATMGPKVPFWDSRDEFGDTNLLVITPEEGQSLARALGPYFTVLLRHHGATVVGTTLQETVFRTIYSYRNAILQREAMAMAALSPLTPGEAAKACARNLEPRPTARAWEYWITRLRKAGAYPPGGTTPAEGTAVGGKSALP